MKKIAKILFPIDLSENFEALLPWVATFVKGFDATLYVLFVAQDLGDFASLHVPHVNLKQLQEEVYQAAQKKMSETTREYFKDFPRVEPRVAQGAPADKIIEVAKKEGVDLIIMGTHARKGLERAIFGSVCDKVVRNAPCPVLTINPALS